MPEAKLIGDNHEIAGSEGGAPLKERQMDEANNAIGRACAANPQPCSSQCMDKAKSGSLFGLGGVPLPLLTDPLGKSTGTVDY